MLQSYGLRNFEWQEQILSEGEEVLAIRVTISVSWVVQSDDASVPVRLGRLSMDLRPDSRSPARDRGTSSVVLGWDQFHVDSF